MKFIRFFLNAAKWAVLIGITFLAVYVIGSKFDISGGFKPFLVQSGSMEPAVMTGDIIVVKKSGSYMINDVVTFRAASERIVTHRIVEVEGENEKRYVTKGDANRSGDEDLISENQIFGKVVLVIPKLGYLVSFAKSRDGLVFLLVIPALVFILDELAKIKKYAKAED